MSIPPPPPALLKLTRKVVSLLGNGVNVNRYIAFLLPNSCYISSNPYSSSNTGYTSIPQCIAIKYGAVSAVVWFYIPPSGNGVLLSFQYPQIPQATFWAWVPWLYVGTDGKLYAAESIAQTAYKYLSTPFTLSPGWHMAVVEEWAASTTGPFYLALYLDGSFIGQVTISSAPLVFTITSTKPNVVHNYIGAGQACGWQATLGCSVNNGWFFFNGVIAYVAFYNRLLSPSDISAIYQGNRVTNGLVAEFVGDNYDPSSNTWVDYVGGFNATVALSGQSPSVIDLVTTEFTSGINYDLLAQKIAEKIAGRPINIANLPINQYGNLSISTPDQWGYPYIDLNGIANNPLKNWFNVLSNASITSNGSSSNYSTGPYRNFLVTIYVGSVSGTSPSLTVYFNAYDSNSGQSIPMASVTLTSAGATYMLVQDFPGNQFNISWVVGGTSPSFGSVYISVYESW